jgi:hypothetical protein
MKTIREFRFPLLVLISSMIIVLFTSYGNKKVHPDLNSMMVDAFLKRNNKGDFSQNEFKKYTFFFEAGTTLKGTTITKDGLFGDMDVTAAGLGFGTNLSSEGPAEMTPKKWIVTGGYSADVPEVPASLRHFYDPTRSAGDRYLTDITNAKIMGTLQKYVLTNPRIDGVEWALGKPGDISEGVQDHKYTWEHGKIWMQMALRESKKDKRNEYMANAWRALGETLHMIADNGCPPHVRNDAHPSPLWGNNTWFGNPDPYEELIDIIHRDNSSEFTGFAKGSANPALVQEFRNSAKASDIAHALAVFTNENFVTNETISGLDKYGEAKKQITHPDIAYTSPVLETMTYNDTDNGYYFAGSKQCTDHYYFADLIPKICDPFVDLECVKSQARILFPNIIEAGANVIKLYIPKLSVEIKSLDKGILIGEIKHRTDQEYPTEIKYNGEVILLIKDKNNREADKIKVQATNGKFEEKGIKLAKGEKMVAQVEFGGILIESDEYMGADDNIFGIYQGTYIMQVNEANMIEAALAQIDPAISGEMMEIQEGIVRHSVKIFIEDVAWIKGGAQGGPIVKFEIGKTKGMEDYYVTSGLSYFVYNLSNTAFIPKFLTPLKDKSNAGTTLVCRSNGFTCTVVSQEGTYTINATFKGNNLEGNWNNSYKGKVLQSATFTARKIVEM